MGYGCTVFQSFANHHHCVALGYVGIHRKRALEGDCTSSCRTSSNWAVIAYLEIAVNPRFLLPLSDISINQLAPTLKRMGSQSRGGPPCLWSITLAPPHPSPHQLRHGLVGLLLQDACCKCGKGGYKEGTKKGTGKQRRERP